MEKNWIEEIKEFIRKAMNKGFKISAYSRPDDEDGNVTNYEFRIFNKDSVVEFIIRPPKLSLYTKKGAAHFDVNFSKRNYLELNAMMLSIEEYSEDIALSDFNNFFGEEENKIVKMEDLDNDED